MRLGQEDTQEGKVAACKGGWPLCPSAGICLASTRAACSLDPAMSILGDETLGILGASLTEERAGKSLQEGTTGGALESPYCLGTAASFTTGNEPLKSQ